MASHSKRQGGWVGMIVLLLALVIVAWLAKDALKKYGLMSTGETTVVRPGEPAERARVPGAADASGASIDVAAPVPTAPMERARDVGNMLKQQEAQRGGGN